MLFNLVFFRLKILLCEMFTVHILIGRILPSCWILVPVAKSHHSGWSTNKVKGLCCIAFDLVFVDSHADWVDAVLKRCAAFYL